MTVDATPPLIALPGTLLDDRSLGAMLALAAPQSGPVHIVVLGDCASLGDELARLALLTSQPAVWLGHSLGGIVALHLALHYPAKVAGLVLLGANARAGSDSSEPRRASQWALAQQQGLSALARSKLAPTYGLETGVDGRVEGNQALLDLLADQARAVGLLRFEHQLAYARQHPGLLAPPRRLHAPVLALSGECDLLCPPADSDEIVSLVSPPAAAVHHSLASAGHLIPMQNPGWAADRLRIFLASLEESPA